MRFEFATATRIVFGAGVVREIGPIAADLGKRALVLTGRSSDRSALLFELLGHAGIETTRFSVSGEPTTGLVRLATQCARDFGAEFVISFGGGSVLDTGKAVAALLTNGGEPLDYLEVIGRGQPVTQRAAPHIAIPTTAGTGAEVTRNAVLKSPEHRVKVSLRSPLILPTVALVDPVLTYTMPPAVTASTGLDAFTQVVECYASIRANPLTDAICCEGITRAARSLQDAYERGDDAAAREDVAIASLFGGLALANSKLGAVHGFAGPLGGMFPAPHGAVCGRLLPFVIEANVRALMERDPESQALRRYDEMGRIVTGSRDATSTDGERWVREVCERLAVPGLATYGITEGDFPAVIEKAARSSSMKGNPIVLTDVELRGILRQAL